MICRVIPYEGSEPYIFLSYCHKDSASVYPLFEQMVKDGYRVWYDNGNNAGDDWPENIAEHLKRSHICLAFISAQSSDSHNCRTEISFAIECRKKLVPVLIENFHMPLGMRMQLSSLHYLKKTDFPSDSGLLNKIYEADGIKDCKGQPGALRPLPKESPEPISPAKPYSSLIRDLSEPSPPIRKDPTNTAQAPDSHRGPTTAQPPVSAAAPAEAPAPVDEKPASPPKRVKLISLKKKPQQHGQTPSTPDPLPEPVPEPVRPEPLPKRADIRQGSEDADIPSSKPSDLTEVPLAEDDPTVYQSDYGDETVCDRNYRTGGIDDDKTVRVSNTDAALLLQPSLQKYFLLKGPQTKIGRHPAQCDVVIEGNASISKHHANIIQSKQKFYLSDEGSSNGTFLNGEPLESKKQVLLDNPAIFQLNDETLILISGLQAKKLIQKGSVALLINEAGTSLRIMESDNLPLNRNNVWPDGKTLKDSTVHRAAHAQLCKKGDGIYLVDESPQNGTYLNDSRLEHGEARKLTSGDHIRLGNNTILEFVMIALKENK